MKRMSLLALGLACVGFGFGAAAGERDLIEQIAKEAGVKPREVQMVLGARTAFAGYRVTYDRVEPRVRAATEQVLARQAAENNRAIATAEPDAATRSAGRGQ